MARTLDEVRLQFPNANHAPREDCKFCAGTGAKPVKNREQFKVLRPPDELPCICIFVDHDMCDFAAESLSATAKKISQEMNNAQ